METTENNSVFLTLAFLEQPDINVGAVGPLYSLRTWNYSDERFPVIRMEELVEGARQAFSTIFHLDELILPDDREFNLIFFLKAGKLET